MALPHNEWRAYLDNILDSYMRTNVTIDAVGYMIDCMEEIFSEYLVAVPEYSSNSVHPLNLDPLQAFLALPYVRSAIPAVPPGAAGVEEKWIVKREIMEYLKSVVELSSLRVLKNGLGSRALPTVKCWLLDERTGQPIYMEPAILSRKAKAETPLQKNANTNGLSPERRTIRMKSSRVLPPSRPTANQKRDLSQKRDSLLTSSIGKWLKIVPVHQEAISQAESEKLLMPKLSIPRIALDGVWTCIRATPFSSGLKNTTAKIAPLRSERVMASLDDRFPTQGDGLGGRISPPLFPRTADPRRRGMHGAQVATSGAKILKQVLKPVFMDIDRESQESDMMDHMRIAEGWPTIPINLGSSSTPPMTADDLGEEDDEAEDVLQIDELMLPSSPPFGNKELKELFRSRMDEILLPRKEYPLGRLGGNQNAMAERQKPENPNKTFSTTLRDTLCLPASIASPPMAKVQDVLATTAARATHQTIDLGAEVGKVLDELCISVKGLDKYSAITKDTIEDKDGTFLPVPSLPPPNQDVAIATLPDVVHLGKPFKIMPVTDTLMALDILPRRVDSVTLVEAAKGTTRLKLELSWQPFAYRGPIFSDQTLCNVHFGPFNPPQHQRDDLVWKRNAPIVQKANQMIEALAEMSQATDADLFGMALGDSSGYNPNQSSSSRWLADVWSGDGILLLTRTEIQRAKGSSARSQPGAPPKDKPDFSEDSRGLIDVENQRAAEKDLDMDPVSENVEDMTLDADRPPLDNDHLSGYQSNLSASPNFPGETRTFFYSQHTASGVETDGHVVMESGSSHGYESAMGRSRTPIGSNPSYFQAKEENRVLFTGGDVGFGSLDVPRTQSNSTPFNARNIDNRPSFPDSRLSHHDTTFSNVNLLQEFLAHRAATRYQYASHQAEGMSAFEDTAQMFEDSFEARAENLSAEEERLTLPPELLSQTIVLPEQWSIPSNRHRYLASLSFLQRRALVQKLGVDCSVDISEIQDAVEADLIVDAHTAVKFITVSDLVPSNFEALSSSIIRLGYGFTRILIVLEAYPFSRSTLSAQKLESSQWEGLKMITQTVVSTFTRLRRTAIIGMGMLEGPDDQDIGEDMGRIQLEFVLSWSPDETVRFIRCMGDYAESMVDDDERVHFWGPRLWLEAPQNVMKDALRYSEYRGMNPFAALALATVMPLPDVVNLPLSDKLRSFGALIGATRMRLFDQQTRTKFDKT